MTILNTLSKPIRDYLGFVPVKLVQTLFSNKSIPEQATRLVRPNFQQVLSWAISRPRVQIIPQKALDPVRQVTRGEEVMGEIVNSKLGAYLEVLHKLLFLHHSLLFLEIVDVSLTEGSHWRILQWTISSSKLKLKHAWLDTNLFVHGYHWAGECVDIFHRTPHWMGL